MREKVEFYNYSSIISIIVIANNVLPEKHKRIKKSEATQEANKTFLISVTFS